MKASFKMKYTAMTMNAYTGSIYWNKPVVEDKAELINHLKRYAKKDSHIYIFSFKDNEKLQLCETLENFK